MVGYKPPSAFMKLRQNRVNAARREAERKPQGYIDDMSELARVWRERLGIGVVLDGEDPALPEVPAGTKLQ